MNSSNQFAKPIAGPADSNFGQPLDNKNRPSVSIGKV
jgi:hypothetical protein